MIAQKARNAVQAMFVGAKTVAFFELRAMGKNRVIV